MDARTIARFWRHVDKNGDAPQHVPNLGPCWVWKSSTTPDGYGVFNIGSVSAGTHRTLRAHRVSFALAFGDAGTASVLHRCDVPRCVRPEHLFAGTQADNMRDCGEKRRGRSGAQRLVAKDVVAIRAASSSGITGVELAKLYGVTEMNISLIISRKTWRNV
jgi:hypothetical protein